MPQLGHVLQLIGLDMITLSQQSKWSLSTDVFEVYKLQVKVNRHNYNYKIIRFSIYNTVKIDQLRCTPLFIT